MSKSSYFPRFFAQRSIPGSSAVNRSRFSVSRTRNVVSRSNCNLRQQFEGINDFIRTQFPPLVTQRTEPHSHRAVFLAPANYPATSPCLAKRVVPSIAKAGNRHLCEQRRCGKRSRKGALRRRRRVRRCKIWRWAVLSTCRGPHTHPLPATTQHLRTCRLKLISLLPYQRTTPATSFGTSEPSYQDLFVAFISTCTLLTAPTSS